MKKLILLAAMVAASSFALADYEDSCRIKSCKPGDVVRIFSPKNDIAPVCANKALHAYVVAIVGLRQMSAQFGVKPTPEADYIDETKYFIDKLRKEAGVSDFKQAAQACAIGKNKQRVTVIEVDSAGSAIRVSPVDGSPQFWILSASLER